LYSGTESSLNSEIGSVLGSFDEGSAPADSVVDGAALSVMMVVVSVTCVVDAVVVEVVFESGLQPVSIETVIHNSNTAVNNLFFMFDILLSPYLKVNAHHIM
jgi:hypothetical protein